MSAAIAGRRPWVKICGVTRPRDAELAVDLGAGFIGLNFWPRSPRAIDLASAREIAAAVGGRAKRVGLFVNEAPSRIEELILELALDFVQLHGDETEAELARFAPRLLRVERGVRVATTSSATTAAAGSSTSGNLPLQRRDLVFPAHLPHAFVLDAPRDGRYGGTATAWAWETARDWIAACPRPVLVAGGVRPENAAAVLAATGAAGIDVASGVESAPGIKDGGRMRRLFEEVRGVAA